MWYVILGAFAYLVVSTLTGWFLQWCCLQRAGSSAGAALPDRLDNLLARNRAWWAMQIVFVTAVALDGVVKLFLPTMRCI